jgi:hypothetical protein
VRRTLPSSRREPDGATGDDEGRDDTDHAGDASRQAVVVDALRRVGGEWTLGEGVILFSRVDAVVGRDLLETVGL